MPLTTFDELAERLDHIVGALGDYHDGRDRTLRMFAEDTLREIAKDVRETAACEAAIAPAKRDELQALIRDPELRAASGVSTGDEPAAPGDGGVKRKRRKPHGGMRAYIPTT